MPRDLRDRVIVITGASSGIGAATARACAAAGMKVVLAARRADQLAAVARQLDARSAPLSPRERVAASAPPGEGAPPHATLPQPTSPRPTSPPHAEAVGALTTSPSPQGQGQSEQCPRHLVVQCNVDSDDDVRRLVDEARAAFGRIDACFANAGYGVVAPVLDTTDAQARAIFETNFHGTLRLLRAAVPVMLATAAQPHVLVCASMASEVAPPHYGVYAATKAAQDAVAQALRAELHGKADVTSVHPIGTRSDFFTVAQRADPGSRDPLQLNTPDRLMQTPEHVARCIVRALRRPRPEVWPSVPSRFLAALCTACPPLAAWALRRMLR